jgi:copper chaperone CopZ
MTNYLHHVPGRLRVRSKVFRCNSVSRNMALRKLRALDGVSTVRLNSKAGSVTVCYDTEKTGPKKILDLLNACECIQAAPVITQHRPKERNITNEIGKMALGALVSKGVSYSISSLLGAHV